MGKTIYGYLLGNDVHVEITQGVIVHVYASRRLNYYTADGLFLSKTVMRLLVCLLEKSDSDLVSYDDILYEVWDVHGLSSSYKRLNHIMRILRENLVRIGFVDDIIMTVRGRGYRFNNIKITPLYSDNARLVSC